MDLIKCNMQVDYLMYFIAPLFLSTLNYFIFYIYNPNLYCWDRITAQHKNIYCTTDVRAIIDHWPRGQLQALWNLFCHFGPPPKHHAGRTMLISREDYGTMLC